MDGENGSPCLSSEKDGSDNIADSLDCDLTKRREGNPILPGGIADKTSLAVKMSICTNLQPPLAHSLRLALCDCRVAPGYCTELISGVPKVIRHGAPCTSHFTRSTLHYGLCY